MRHVILLPFALWATGVLCGPLFATITAPARLAVRQTQTALTCNLLPTDSVPGLCALNLGTFSPVFGSTPTPSISIITSTDPPSATPSAALPSCSLQDADPDRGIDKAYCICSLGSLTTTATPLSVGTTAVGPDASCAYTTIPGGAAIVTPTVNLGPAVTNSALCQVCTPYAINEDDCTVIPDCLPQAAAATVQAGSSPVHVGTLTGTALYTAISSALETLCPSVTQTNSATVCETNAVTIGGIPYIDVDSLIPDGELVVQVDASGYNATSLRDAMIQSAALTVQHSAAGNNCYNATYLAENLSKRGDWISSLFGRDHPDPVKESIMLCNAVQFAGVLYYNQFWRDAPEHGPSDYIAASWKFQVGPGGGFGCDFLGDLVDALVVVEPEFAVADVELGEKVRAICTQALNLGSP